MPVSPPAWTDQDLKQPHHVADKARRVEAMFAAIAPRYDLNNRLHSLGMDQVWRRRAVAMACVQPGEVVLDVACGTGDLAMAFAQRSTASRVIGLDFTYNMLTIARSKPPGGTPGGLRDPGDPGDPGECVARPAYLNADAMRLPLADASVDVVSIAFGLRNVVDPAGAVRQFHRVLRPGGRLIILEFGLPNSRLIRGVYNLYFNHVMPRTAALIARDRRGAYRYLPKSVNTFMTPATILQQLTETGFVQTSARRLTMGVAVIYRGIKPHASADGG